MKLILASDLSFLLKYGYDLTGISKSEMKIGYIITASKTARDPSWFNKTRQTIKETGFADILKELLSKGKVYIGTSAGAYIMCPTIEVANWNDTGRDRFGLEDFTALNYVPFVLKVHYTDEQEPKVRDNLAALKYPLRILRDEQGILVEDGKYTFVGGTETKF